MYWKCDDRCVKVVVLSFKAHRMEGMVGCVFVCFDFNDFASIVLYCMM